MVSIHEITRFQFMMYAKLHHFIYRFFMNRPKGHELSHWLVNWLRHELCLSAH